MASVDILPEAPLVRYESEYTAIIYLKCESAFPTTRISTHFRLYHHYPLAVYQSILQSFKQKALAKDWMDVRHPAPTLYYIIGVDKNSGQGKGYPNSDQTFQADFNELLFILISLKLIEIPGNSHSDHSQLARFTADHSEKLGLQPHGNMVS